MQIAALHHAVEQWQKLLGRNQALLVACDLNPNHVLDAQFVGINGGPFELDKVTFGLGDALKPIEQRGSVRPVE